MPHECGEPGVRIELVPSSARAVAAARWRHLEPACDGLGLTNSWAWVAPWLTHYGEQVPHAFAFGVKGNADIGAAVVTFSTIRIKWIGVPSVHLGTAGEPDAETTYVQRNQLLVNAAQLDDFAAALVAWIPQRPWSRFNLDGMVPTHAAALTRAGGARGLRWDVDPQSSPTFAFPLAAAHGHPDVISALGPNTRHSIRRSLRLLGPLTTEWAQTPEQAHDILRDLIGLHQQRWTHCGAPGAFARARVVQYHADLIDELLPRGELVAFRVKRGADTVGALLNFVEDGYALSYKSGFAQYPEDNRLKPGLVTHALCMEECRQRGFDGYDFLTGDVPYKRQLANTERVVSWACADRGPRMQVICGIRAVCRQPRIRALMLHGEAIIQSRR